MSLRRIKLTGNSSKAAGGVNVIGSATSGPTLVGDTRVYENSRDLCVCMAKVNVHDVT